MTHQGPITPAASSAPDAADPPTAAAPRSGERWTPPKMAAFLRALSATHSVSAAARSVGMSRQSAYRLRSRLKGQEFDTAWNQAFHHSYDNLAHAALERALNGIEVPHYYKGELVGTSRRYDERLTVALLNMVGSAQTSGIGSHQPAALRSGQRFAALIERIEAGGESAAADAEARSFADSADLSPMPDQPEMADLCGFGAGEGG
ncbi:hypothetical protein [Croceibacterium aestuarii]|uniref:hypothetical protein n=1 Tax=Croceibacterium aestuarii TaxID=3064139 RepID=UPI00272E0C92|nr:hypothetical protein [Croceibacterium sp. D39]